MPNPTWDKRAKKREGLIPNPKARLFDQIREVMRFHHYSYRTEKTYAQWVRRYLAFHRQPDTGGAMCEVRWTRETNADWELRIAEWEKGTTDGRGLTRMGYSWPGAQWGRTRIRTN